MTVAELMAILAKENPNTTVVSIGPDCGGYDYCWGKNVIIARQSGYICVYHHDDYDDDRYNPLNNLDLEEY